MPARSAVMSLTRVYVHLVFASLLFHSLSSLSYLPYIHSLSLSVTQQVFTKHVLIPGTVLGTVDIYACK